MISVFFHNKASVGARPPLGVQSELGFSKVQTKITRPESPIMSSSTNFVVINFIYLGQAKSILDTIQNMSIFL